MLHKSVAYLNDENLRICKNHHRLPGNSLTACNPQKGRLFKAEATAFTPDSRPLNGGF